MKKLKLIRRSLAVLAGVALLLTFLDITGTLHHWFGWLAKVQLLPALLALNVGVLVALVLGTLLFGRIYCSVICPLGIMQDAIAWLGRKAKPRRYSYSPEKRWLRWIVLVLMVASMLAGVSVVFSALAPYSTFGRIVTTLLQPLYILANNLLADMSASADNYLFYHHPLWIRSMVFVGITAVHLLVIATLAWHGGRTYCNTICPVGTLLSVLARFSWLKIRIEEDKCKSCGRCAKNCKAACIDVKNKQIDYSRCVVCGNCIGECSFGALTYAPVSCKKKTTEKEAADGKPVDKQKRAFLLSAAAATASLALAEDKIKLDGGLARIEDKVAPKRQTPLTPPGSWSAKHFQQHCTACQLCISECPNGVLRPSTKLDTLMQPEMSYENGHCRLECNRCSAVCPTGAIRPIQKEEKTAIQIGHAVWIKENCLPAKDGTQCGNCARHCPVGAIEMVPINPDDRHSPRIPAINEAACIGCGACEHLCPSRPLSAIYVEGHERHREI